MSFESIWKPKRPSSLNFQRVAESLLGSKIWQCVQFVMFPTWFKGGWESLPLVWLMIGVVIAEGGY